MQNFMEIDWELTEQSAKRTISEKKLTLMEDDGNYDSLSEWALRTFDVFSNIFCGYLLYILQLDIKKLNLSL